jgi:hypothetical protein
MSSRAGGGQMSPLSPQFDKNQLEFDLGVPPARELRAAAVAPRIVGPHSETLQKLLVDSSLSTKTLQNRLPSRIVAVKLPAGTVGVYNRWGGGMIGMSQDHLAAVNRPAVASVLASAVVHEVAHHNYPYSDHVLPWTRDRASDEGFATGVQLQHEGQRFGSGGRANAYESDAHWKTPEEAEKYAAAREYGLTGTKPTEPPPFQIGLPLSFRH